MSIKNNFDNMIDNVVEEYNYEISKTKEYSKLQDEYSKLFNNLKQFLPKENLSILFNLDSIVNSLENINGKLIYEKGLKDGIELKNILKIVS